MLKLWANRFQILSGQELVIHLRILLDARKKSMSSLVCLSNTL